MLNHRATSSSCLIKCKMLWTFNMPLPIPIKMYVLIWQSFNFALMYHAKQKQTMKRENFKNLLLNTKFKFRFSEIKWQKINQYLETHFLVSLNIDLLWSDILLQRGYSGILIPRPKETTSITWNSYLLDPMKQTLWSASSKLSNF